MHGVAKSICKIFSKKKKINMKNVSLTLSKLQIKYISHLTTKQNISNNRRSQVIILLSVNTK